MSVINFFLSISSLALLATVCSGCSVQTRDSSNGDLGQRYDVDFTSARLPRNAAATQSNSSIFHNYIKAEYLHAKDEVESIEYLKAAAETASQNDEQYLRMRMAQLYILQGAFDDALGQIDRLLVLDDAAPDILLMKAGVYESIKEYDQARPLYEQLIERQVDVGQVKLLLANLEIQEGNAPAAEQSLKEILTDEPHNELAVYLLVQLLESQSRVAEALQLLAQLRERDPGNARALTESIKLNLRHNAQDINEVEKLSRDLLEANSTSILARRLLSEIALRRKNFPEALEHLYVLEDIQAERADVRLKIALISLDQGNYKEAEKQLELLIASDPADDRATFYLASLRSEQGLVGEALGLLERIQSDSAFYARAMVLASVLHLRNEDNNSAIQSLRNAYEAGMRSPAVLLQLSSLLSAADKFEEAIAVYEELTRVDSSSHTLHRYASLLYEAGRYGDALEVLQNIVQSGNAPADMLNLYAYILALQDERLVEALSYIEQAITLRSEDPYFLDTRGWILFRLNRLDEAYRDLRVAAELAPEDIVILSHFARVLHLTGREDGGRTVAQQAIESAKNKEMLRPEEREALNVLRKLFEK
jgi:tetratricopeptide (TPR) repeat protein